ncbi:hypothetical protein [Flavonifractor sp. An306]|nr:hypothetical protein [Flavonifractor sp. An306]
MELNILNANALEAHLESMNDSLCEYAECCGYPRDGCGDCLDCCTSG